MKTAAREARTGYYSPQHRTDYRGYTIKTAEFYEGWLIGGHMVHNGFTVGCADGSLNVMPGATWFLTVQHAKEAIDDLIASRVEQGFPEGMGNVTEAVQECTPSSKYGDFDAGPFWARVRVRKTAKDNALRMARLLQKLAKEGSSPETEAEMEAILFEIDDSADTRSTTVYRDGSRHRNGPRPERLGLDYL